MPANTGNQSISVKLKWPITNTLLSFLLVVIGYQSLIWVSPSFSSNLLGYYLILLLIFSCHWVCFTFFPFLTWKFLPSFLLFLYFEIFSYPISFAIDYSHFLLGSFYLPPFPLFLYILLITSLIYAQKYLFIPLTGKNAYTYILIWELMHFQHKKWDQRECQMEH